MTDRSTRDDMRHDALLNQTAQAADFAAHHVRAIVAVVVVIAVVGLGWVFLQSNRGKAEEKAAEVLFHAQYEYDSGNYAAASTHLEELERNMGGTSSAKLGRTLAGNVHAAQGQWEDALADFERALDENSGDPLLSMTAGRARAVALEALGRHQEAADAFEELARLTDLETARMQFLYQAGRNHAAAGALEQAGSLYQEVSQSAADGRTAGLAALRLAELERAGP